MKMFFKKWWLKLVTMDEGVRFGITFCIEITFLVMIAGTLVSAWIMGQAWGLYILAACLLITGLHVFKVKREFNLVILSRMKAESDLVNHARFSYMRKRFYAGLDLLEAYQQESGLKDSPMLKKEFLEKGVKNIKASMHDLELIRLDNRYLE